MNKSDRLIFDLFIMSFTYGSVRLVDEFTYDYIVTKGVFKNISEAFPENEIYIVGLDGLVFNHVKE